MRVQTTKTFADTTLEGLRDLARGILPPLLAQTMRDRTDALGGAAA